MRRHAPRRPPGRGCAERPRRATAAHHPPTSLAQGSVPPQRQGIERGCQAACSMPLPGMEAGAAAPSV